MSELTDNFDGLPNQSLAYRESLMAVRYIVEKYGEGALLDLIKELGSGKSIDQAIQDILSLNGPEFEAGWQDWARSVFKN